MDEARILHREAEGENRVCDQHSETMTHLLRINSAEHEEDQLPRLLPRVRP
jgi:hypothetical protein